MSLSLLSLPVVASFSVPWLNPNDNDAPGVQKFVAFSVADQLGQGLRRTQGTVKKNPKPLFKQDQPWEARCDNAYPNVVHDPSDPLGAWRLWYGCFIVSYGGGQGSHRQNAWLYANSSDGLEWTKPSVGKLDLSRLKDPKPASFAKIKKANSVVLGNSDGMGIFRDASETNASRRFKVFGTGCFGDDALTDCVSGTAVSADGLHFTDATAQTWPSPQRYDDHQNLFLDARTGEYVLTTRDYTSTSGRDIGLVRSAPHEWNQWAATTENVEAGDNAHQLYSQITFPYYNIYLGLVMVFDTANPSTVGTVHCRLSWSNDTHHWQWVDDHSAGGGLTGDVFIPLGSKKAFDSHIIFAGAFPTLVKGAGPSGEDAIRVYYMGGNGPHNGARNTSLGLATLRPDGFVAVAGTGTFTTRPVRCSGSILVLSVDIGGASSSPAVSASSASAGGSMKVAVLDAATGKPVPGLAIGDCTPLTAPTAATDAKIVFAGGASLAALVGKDIRLQFALSNSKLYTFGFE